MLQHASGTYRYSYQLQTFSLHRSNLRGQREHSATLTGHKLKTPARGFGDWRTLHHHHDDQISSSPFRITCSIAVTATKRRVRRRHALSRPNVACARNLGQADQLSNARKRKQAEKVTACDRNTSLSDRSPQAHTVRSLSTSSFAPSMLAKLISPSALAPKDSSPVQLG